MGAVTLPNTVCLQKALNKVSPNLVGMFKYFRIHNSSPPPLCFKCSSIFKRVIPFFFLRACLLDAQAECLLHSSDALEMVGLTVFKLVFLTKNCNKIPSRNF